MSWLVIRIASDGRRILSWHIIKGLDTSIFALIMTRTTSSKSIACNLPQPHCRIQC